MFSTAQSSLAAALQVALAAAALFMTIFCEPSISELKRMGSSSAAAGDISRFSSCQPLCSCCLFTLQQCYSCARVHALSLLPRSEGDGTGLPCCRPNPLEVCALVSPHRRRGSSILFFPVGVLHPFYSRPVTCMIYSSIIVVRSRILLQLQGSGAGHTIIGYISCCCCRGSCSPCAP